MNTFLHLYMCINNNTIEIRNKMMVLWGLEIFFCIYNKNNNKCGNKVDRKKNFTFIHI